MWEYEQPYILICNGSNLVMLTLAYVLRNGLIRGIMETLRRFGLPGRETISVLWLEAGNMNNLIF